MNILEPSKEQALQFALMLKAGMPSTDAILYFLPADEDQSLAARPMLERWMKSATFSAAFLAVQGKPWQDMSLEEQMRFAIDKHYTEMAYFLYSHNYNDLTGQDKTKADTCRQTLEAKIAGMAGKLDALTRFFDDVSSGRVKLAPAPVRMS